MTANNHTQLYGSGLDWFSQTENPTLVGGNWIAATTVNPNATEPGAATLNSYSIDTSSGGVFLDFTLGNDGTLTYGIVSAPEPTTYGLMAGLGLLMIAFRRRSSKA
jgi:hypothetical protein